MENIQLDKKSICIGVGLGLGANLLWRYATSYTPNAIKKVLCIEIGGTSSRFAIYKVNPKAKEINQESELIKKNINSPTELCKLLKGNHDSYSKT
jgi:glucokinase